MPVKVMLHPSSSMAQELRSGKTALIDSNVAGIIGWDRLVSALRAYGEIKRYDEVEAFVLTDTGIMFHVRGK